MHDVIRLLNNFYMVFAEANECGIVTDLVSAKY